MKIKFAKKYILIVLMFLSFSLSSQSNDWFTVAKKDVSYKSDKDVINLRGNEKEISQFKIKCTQGNLKIKDIVVYYKDKSKTNKKTKGTGLLTKGMSSFVFNIEKGKIIDKIELSYEAIGNMLVTKRAKIELLGRKK
jgi:hypothetical protein